MRQSVIPDKGKEGFMDKKLYNIKRSFLRLNDKIFKGYFSYGEEREELQLQMKASTTVGEIYHMGEELLEYLQSDGEYYDRDQIADVTMWLWRWKEYKAA